MCLSRVIAPTKSHFAGTFLNVRANQCLTIIKCKNMQFHIAFDESHGERGKLGTNYRTVRQVLESEGYGCWEFSSFPITRQSLANYDMLVIACTDSTKFSTEEMEAIATWVKQDGGGLLLLNHAGGDRGRRTNMGELASQFGMLFENDQVLDDMNNFGIDNMPNIKEFPTPHPIIEGITSICYRAGCSVSITGFSQAVALTNASSSPGNVSIIVASEQTDGRIVCIGSYEIFRDEISGGIDQHDHVQLLKNIFQWLVTPKRVSLREGGEAPQPSNAAASGGSFDPYGVTKTQASQPQDYSGKLVQITTIHDLFLEIQNILKELDLVRARVTNVYNVASLLDSGEGEKASPASEPRRETQPPARASAPRKKQVAEETLETPEAAPVTQASKDDIIALIQGKKEKKPDRSKSASATSKSSKSPAKEVSMGGLLTELKSEQSTKKHGISDEDMKDLEVSQPGLGKVAEDEEVVKVPPATKKEYILTSTDKRKTKEELEDEIEKLEAKLKSVEDLKKFVDKKFKDGKISKEEHDKDVKKRLSEIDATKSKIEAFKALAESKA